MYRFWRWNSLFLVHWNDIDWPYQSTINAMSWFKWTPCVNETAQHQSYIVRHWTHTHTQNGTSSINSRCCQCRCFASELRMLERPALEKKGNGDNVNQLIYCCLHARFHYLLFTSQLADFFQWECQSSFLLLSKHQNSYLHPRNESDCPSSFHLAKIWMQNPITNQQIEQPIII